MSQLYINIKSNNVSNNNNVSIIMYQKIVWMQLLLSHVILYNVEYIIALIIIN